MGNVARISSRNRCDVVGVVGVGAAFFGWVGAAAVAVAVGAMWDVLVVDGLRAGGGGMAPTAPTEGGAAAADCSIDDKDDDKEDVVFVVVALTGF